MTSWAYPGDEWRWEDMKHHLEKMNAESTIYRTPKELCSRHGTHTVGVTQACTGAFVYICTNCGLEVYE